MAVWLGWAAGGRGAPGIAQRPTDARIDCGRNSHEYKAEQPVLSASVLVNRSFRAVYRDAVRDCVCQGQLKTAIMLQHPGGIRAMSDKMGGCGWKLGSGDAPLSILYQ